ncbi:hypothetical protein SAMN06297387_10854 [Streptomyces zhaozhouensis]|uniref:Biotin-requiring enzyme n=1 Tax=Streptomyces zhaozhouensis TaxID=1300267 RepID=A0A286DW50_9ACTN|nr:hypothetical protein [Streptomyces zhaozhouensis]SOD62891.1 hypothetical protein SAMN06297387_10854 [Streptomyces zhaozhouensis]
MAGILNVLRSRGQLTDRPARPGDPLVTRAATTLHSPEPGFLSLRKTSGQTITRGEHVGFIRPLTGAPVPLTAPVDGVVLRSAAEATVAEGDRVITVAATPG